ncbi:glycoside hydrolase family 43 protein [Streptomyces litchfieldiae]|uniref:Glycoside hydrolase family 43 protein n=1 Tax=Streptomyces litchfieldiae TaxID=3075543 RepID=A0ABU2MJL3_9ACTN|nr:glycoside hydrolase family 43 protein [Streptomyces sp. DSM 44938]MDT0341796.1 glycoside hydrolase family 43 protein [Streptomyces sp. DSM 44938]
MSPHIHARLRKRRLLAFLLAMAGCAVALLQTGGPAAAGEEPAPAAAFTNPIVTENAADPWIVQHEGRYYHLGTTWASHWEMRSADTLAGLRTADPVTIYEETEPSRCCNFWAPELHRLDGPNGPRWCLTYSAGVAANIDNQHVHVLESAGDDPLGPYTYRGQVDPYGDNRWMIDSSYLTMPDGRLHLLHSFWEGGTQNLYIAPMSNPWTSAGRGVRIATPTHAWERSGAGVNEGPVILRHDGRTFLVFSASHCDTPDYKLGLMELTGADPMNPASWTKYPDPVFERNDAAGVYGPGHNGFFTSPDGTETWIVYHANASATDGCSGTRTSRAQRIEWNADGTPDFGTPVAPGVELPGPAGE